MDWCSYIGDSHVGLFMPLHINVLELPYIWFNYLTKKIYLKNVDKDYFNGMLIYDELYKVLGYESIDYKPILINLNKFIKIGWNVIYN